MSGQMDRNVDCSHVKTILTQTQDLSGSIKIGNLWPFSVVENGSVLPKSVTLKTCTGGVGTVE